eukprot:GFKZ01000234.1.p1 GENE.GFKZ01000234.1~~GFKZ01000234.1.p1  ORF type:complete len:907 (-),score=146.03 GFKZ01000234.1:92-2812(-)
MTTAANGFPLVSAPTEGNTFQILEHRQKPNASRKGSRSSAARTQTKQSPRPQEFDSSHVTQGAVDTQLAAQKHKPRPGSYQALGLNAPLCQALHSAGYSFPTPIQRKVIPHILAGDDVVAMARTGSGKTAAFLAPILHRLFENPLPMSVASRRNGPRALVIAPTRELVLQELKFCRLYSKFLKPALRTAVVVGGTPLEAQFEALAVCPDIVFATPGRLLQMLAEMGAKGGLTLSTAEVVVFDEADRLFEGTLAVETAALISNLKNRQTEALEDRQSVLISATMPHALAEFSRTGLRKCLSVVRLDADRGISPTLAVGWLCTRGDLEKDAALQVLVRKLVEAGRTGVVFAGTHRRVEYLTELLRACIAKDVACVHGNMDQTARIDAVASFRKKKAQVLVVTDVAARGIDLPELDVVINYDAAATPKLFVHRVGRVGRAGRFGLAINLVTAEEIPYALDILLFVGRGVRFAESPSGTHSQDMFTNHAFAMETTFTFGILPRTVVDDEVELTRNAVTQFDIAKAYKSAKNAHGLYTKTRGTASGESVRRAKELLINPDGSRRDVQVHPWFANMESTTEREAAVEAARLSVWRPKDCVVSVPRSLLKRKRKVLELNEDEVIEEDGSNTGKNAKSLPGFLESLESMKSDPQEIAVVSKLSARQARMEEERKQFFLPSHQDSSKVQAERALKVFSGGKMGDGLNAFRELNEAAMDLTADGNSELLRAKHTGSSSVKYWDRVTKKFVKGGVTTATSKRNLHVASREAKARAKAGLSYSSEDGALFKKWLQKNKTAVQQLAERVEEGGTAEAFHLGRDNGLGSNDFRKGAFGRKARIAAAAREKSAVDEDRPKGQKPKSELKTREEIKKARKLKAKAEARRQARAKKKGKSGSRKIGNTDSRAMEKSRMIVRRK